MPDLLSFLSVVFITSFTPGPNNIMSMYNASKFGFKKSFPFNLGILVGFIIIMGLCTAISSALGRIIPGIKPFMQVAGAVYILWLGWKTYKSGNGNNGKSGDTNSFTSGLLLQFVNPKVILYGITLISTFVTPYYSSLPILIGFSIFLAFIGFFATCCWAIFGSIFQKVLSENGKLVNGIMAILLVLCAVSILI